MSDGLVYIFTGDGKGKTSAALGVAMRAVGHGKRVAMIQWYKERKWQIGEHNIDVIARSPLGRLRTMRQSLFEIYPMGQGFYKLPTDHATPNEHKKAAEEAMELARRLLQERKVNRLTGYKAENKHELASNLPAFQPAHLFLLILDEVLNAVNDGLINRISLIRLIRQRQSTHTILTGRNAPEELIKLADLVTEMKNIKHPYEKGKKAVIGLDF